MLTPSDLRQGAAVVGLEPNIVVTIAATALDAADPRGNAFESRHQLIVRLDQMARNPDLQRKLVATRWDLVIFDEAHNLAAHYFGSKLEKTFRYELAELLGGHTRHLLLMTATPHNGKEEDYQLFLALLDGDRFYGKFLGEGVHKSTPPTSCGGW
jgi:superfamily II DNA or RNA helicase